MSSSGFLRVMCSLKAFRISVSLSFCKASLRTCNRRTVSRLLAFSSSEIVSPHAGDVLSEVRSPTDGVLFTLREYPVVYEGSLMARIVQTAAGGIR